MTTYKIVSMYDGEVSISEPIVIDNHSTIEEFARKVFYALAPPGYDSDEFDQYFTVTEIKYAADVKVWRLDIDGDESVEVAVQLT